MKEDAVEKARWREVLRVWRVGPACQLERARQYTAAYPERFAGWIVMADALWHTARYREAAAHLRKAQRLMPAKLKGEICHYWGSLYQAKNDLRRAEAWFRRAIKVKPTTTAHIQLGAVVARQGRFAEAKKHHSRAIQLATPGHPVDEAHLNLGLILRAEGKYRIAASHFAEAIRLDPRYRDARVALKDVRRVLKMRGAG